MTFTYDTETTAGQVRLLVTDTDPERAIFDDAEVRAFLAMNADEVLLAAAQALDTIATNEALVQKRITLLDLSTDGPATAAALRAHAKALREQFESGSGDDELAFDTAEFADGVFDAEDRMRREILRRGE
jgi:hypothetical protein